MQANVSDKLSQIRTCRCATIHIRTCVHTNLLDPFLRGDDGVMERSHQDEWHREFLAEERHQIPKELGLMAINVADPVEGVPLLDFFFWREPIYIYIYIYIYTYIYIWFVFSLHALTRMCGGKKKSKLKIRNLHSNKHKEHSANRTV